MNEQAKFPETVILIDAAFLNLITTDIKSNFSQKLQRELPAMDLSHFITYISLDSGIAEGENDIQVLIVYDDKTSSLNDSTPSDLKKELNGVAFRNSFGEFSFASISPEGMVERAELYLELTTMITESTDAQKVILIPFMEEYGNELTASLTENKEKEIIVFNMLQPGQHDGYRQEIIAYPIMQALGIKGNEL